MIDFDKLWDISENKYRIQQKKWEWVSFLEFISDKNIKNILEIGCYDGGSTYSLSHFTTNMITIDAFNPARFNVKDIESICNYEYVGNSSHNQEVFNYIKQKIPIVDLLFIDGDHSYEGSLRDYIMYKELVKDGGYIAFHDIVNSEDHRRAGCGVHKTWAQIKEIPYMEFICDAKNNTYFAEDSELALWGGIGVKLNKK